MKVTLVHVIHGMQALRTQVGGGGCYLNFQKEQDHLCTILGLRSNLDRISETLAWSEQGNVQMGSRLS